jgi:hypothetical protein
MSKHMTGTDHRVRRTAAMAVVALAATATAILGSAAGSASAAHASAAPASAVASAAIKPTTCHSSTFDVYYGTASRKCYSGLGHTAVRIPGVHRITTGINKGAFVIFVPGRGFQTKIFAPHQRFSFSAKEHAKLYRIELL